MTSPPRVWTLRTCLTLAVLTLVYAFNHVDRTLLGLLIPQIKAELALSDTMIGVLSGLVFSIFYVAAAVPVARLADRLNRRNLIAVGFAFWSLMTVATGFVRSAGQLALTRFALGLGEATSVPPSTSIIADLFPKSARPLALGVFSMATSFGLLFAFPLLGSIAQSRGWRAAFLTAGVVGLGVAALVLALREPTRGAQESTPPPSAQESTGAALKALLKDPPYVLAALATAAINLNLASISVWLPAFLARVHGLSTSEIGAWIGLLRGSAGVAGTLLGGWAATYLARRNPRWLYRVPAFAMAMAAPAELLLLFGQGTGTWRAAMAVEMFFVTAQIGPLYAMLMASVAPQRRATAIAVALLTANLLGQALGPLLVGAISDALTPALHGLALRYALLVAVVAALAAAGLCRASGVRTHKNPVQVVAGG